MRFLVFIIPILFILNSCIKPYSCECINEMTQKKNHVLIYSTKSSRGEACKKNGRDTLIDNIRYPYISCYIK